MDLANTPPTSVIPESPTTPALLNIDAAPPPPETALRRFRCGWDDETRSAPLLDNASLEHASRDELLSIIRRFASTSPGRRASTPVAQVFDPLPTPRTHGRLASDAFAAADNAIESPSHRGSAAEPVPSPMVRVASAANIVMLEVDDDSDDGAEGTPATHVRRASGSINEQSVSSALSAGSIGFKPASASTSVLDLSMTSTQPQGGIAASLRRKAASVPETVGSLSVYNAIGRGAVGAVYCALDEELEETRALKVVPRSRVLYTPAGVPKEAAVLHALGNRSEHIARLYECIDDPASADVFFAMELVGPDAQPLAQLNGGGEMVSASVGPREIGAVVEQLGAALGDMRRHLVAHGDLKPDNILVTRPDGPDGPPHIRLIDFGAAHIATRRMALCVGGDPDSTACPPPPGMEPLDLGQPSTEGAALTPQVTPHGVHASMTLLPSADADVERFSDNAEDKPRCTSCAALPCAAATERSIPAFTISGDSPDDLTSDDDVDGGLPSFPSGAPPVGSALNVPRSSRDGSINDTLPTAFRRRTIAVTLRSPSHGPTRARATRKQLDAQQRRSLGRKTAQAGATAFAAPELTQGLMPTPAADMWSAGVILFLLLFGKPPFAGATRAELEQAIVAECPDFPPIADMSASQRHWYPLVSRMLNKEPLTRPAPSELHAAARESYFAKSE
eukprot:CAMPEP_0174879504 /NCGR_PEP_ID=MMETSP1114-20130205/83297_1 /TAXON_ID=312471 /ORGANISM="Neobodo designis, Strain CCAP 1951/1" /LENGTH=678 /DNA_ID=CAMNT_0016114899 /DNA_START=168 /DNA_END=2204 /DNA_ORIENTATION=-